MPITIIIFLNSFFALSLDWWTIPREEGPTHLSYVASSEGEGSLEELKERAFMAAAVIIVREHFGTTVEASESMIEETGNSKFQFMTKVKSDPMIIKGLKLTDLKILESENKTRVLVRVSISKVDLAHAVKEQKRDQVENIYGRGKGEHFVLVKTIPQGAFIQITGIDKKYFVQGNGDAKFYLPRGEYNITINEEGYAPTSSRFNIYFLDQELKFDLSPILGKLLIETVPSDAVITPLVSTKGENPFFLQPHKNYRFRVAHPDYFEEEFEFTLSDDREYTKKIILQSRPSSVRFIISPEPEIFKINDKNYKNGDRISLGEENLHLVVEARGYERVEKKILLKPNRYYPDEYLKLTPQSEPIPLPWQKFSSFNFFKDTPLKKRVEYNPYVQLDGKGDFSIVPLSFYLERSFLSFGASYNYIESTNDDGEKSIQKSISDFSLNLRFVINHFDSFVPYFVLSAGSYQVKESIDDLKTIEDQERKYSYYGAGGGFRFYYSDTSSVHVEMIHLSRELKENSNPKKFEKEKSSEIKALIGLGMEF